MVGPSQSPTRQVDQLICLDDRSDIVDVRDLLEHARRTAALAGVGPLPDEQLAGVEPLVINTPSTLNPMSS